MLHPVCGQPNYNESFHLGIFRPLAQEKALVFVTNMRYSAYDVPKKVSDRYNRTLIKRRDGLLDTVQLTQ